MNNFVSEIIKKIKTRSHFETIFGKPIELSTVTIIPVAKTCGKSVSTKEVQDMQRLHPVGYIEIRKQNVRFIPLYDSGELLVFGAISGIGLYFLYNKIKKRLVNPFKDKITKFDSLSSSKNGLKRLIKILGISVSVVLAGFATGKLLSNRKKHSFQSTVELCHLGKDQTSHTESEMSEKNTENERVWDNPEIVKVDESYEELLKEDKTL